MPKLLLIEDDTDTREALCAVLAEEGYEVVAVVRAEDAFATVDTRAFDAVLTDSINPTASDPFGVAVDLARRVAPTPVGLHTGWVGGREPEAARRHFAFVCHKPTEIGDLLTLLAAVTAKRLDRGTSPEVDAAYRYFQLLSRRSWDDFAALCDDGVRYTLAGKSSLAATVDGKRAFRAFTERTFKAFPDAVFDDVYVYAVPDGLAARYTTCFTDPGGAAVRQSGSVQFRFRAGLITSIAVSTDDLRLESKMAR
ncbi:MAG: nuclear transport factor 2 family protein [Myxococcales bacterium]